MKILLVEDEKRMAQALCQILRLENYEVDHCADGLSGLEAIETDIYDIIILDVVLPGKPIVVFPVRSAQGFYLQKKR